MNDRENDNRIKDEGRQVQQELEDQLRAFGDTMTDAFAHGFEGRGMEIGDRAYDVGRAAVHAANYGIGEAGKAFRKSWGEARQNWAKQTFNEGYAEADTSGMPGWFRQIFAKPEPTPVENIRISAKKRYSNGCTLLAVGITFAVIFGLGTLGCLIGLGTISPAALGDVVVSATEGGGILMTGTDYVMNTAYNVLGIVSSVLGLATAGFGWMTACGAARMKAGRQMGQFADYADSVDYHKGLPVSMLAAFAVMGSCYVNKVEGRKDPSVALTNNGAEESKGTPMLKEAHQLLKTTPGIRFVGNIEPRDVPNGEVDVVVCDGFTGNVILKLTEGVAKMLLGMLKQMFLANFGGKIAYLLLKGGVSDLKHQMDSEEYGGAPFLGAKQPVIKAHGSSKAKGIKNAIRQAKTCVENDLCGTMQSALDELAAANKPEE